MEGQYRALATRFASLIQRLRRHHGPIEYALTVEAQRNGTPHLNVVLFSPTLTAIVDANAQAERDGRGPLAREMHSLWKRYVGARAMHPEIERPRDVAELAAYLVKSADRSSRGHGLVAEMAKSNQLPVDAPDHFRRLRFSRGLVRPLAPQSRWAGEVVEEPLERVEARLAKEAVWIASLDAPKRHPHADPTTHRKPQERSRPHPSKKGRRPLPEPQDAF